MRALFRPVAGATMAACDDGGVRVLPDPTHYPQDRCAENPACESYHPRDLNFLVTFVSSILHISCIQSFLFIISRRTLSLINCSLVSLVLSSSIILYIDVMIVSYWL